MNELVFLAKYQWIELEKYILRPLLFSDIHDMYEYASDAETTAFLSFSRHKTIYETTQIIVNYFIKNPLGKWAVVEKSTQKMIGTIEFKIDGHKREASFGYVLNRKYWGNGIIAQGTGKITSLLFDELPIQRIFGEFVSDNSQSERVMQKIGLSYKKEYKGKILNSIRPITEYELTRKTYMRQKISDDL